MNKFEIGQKVTFNGGFPGTVVRYYSPGMIEVRGQSGLCCIPVEDAQPTLDSFGTFTPWALNRSPF